MSKFNSVPSVVPNSKTPLKLGTVLDSTTYEGAPAATREAKTELFLAAVSDFGNEGSFYENASNRTDRIKTLTKEVALSDPQWMTDFISWLRNDANMRSISLIIALDAAKAMLDAKVPGSRSVVYGALVRADEPGEALAYWTNTYGKTIPSAVKRGVSDAVLKLYNEFSLSKYDTASKGFRFGDVIRLTHPSPEDPKQAKLFKHAIERRKDSSARPDESLTLLANKKVFLALSKEEKLNIVLSKDGTKILKEAGLTWENIASEIGLNAKVWEALIPNLGYMALIRNLRNFIGSGVSRETLSKVADRIADKNQVAKSRQLPFRFLSAYNSIESSGNFELLAALEKALNFSLENVPSLDGKTLILVDRSGSMFYSPSDKNGLDFADSAAIFGSTLALRAENSTLVQFGSDSSEVSFNRSGSVLNTLKEFDNMGGTNTHAAITKFYNSSYDRVIVITDEQYNDYNYVNNIKGNMYIWNLEGYSRGFEAAKNRHLLGGLSDQSFKMINMIEAGRKAQWPWSN